MVSLDILCTTIRLSPIWVCLAVHCSNGHWPSQLESIQRVLDYGFSINVFRRRPEVLLTHIFVHANDTHLFSNMFSLFTSLIEFGGASVHENIEETRLFPTIRRTLGSFLVFLIAGVSGGIGGQLLFNDAQRTRRRAAWLHPIKSESTDIAAHIQKLMGNFTDRIERRRNERVFMCGASAGVCALVGFNAAFYDRWFITMGVMLPEFVAVGVALFSDQPSGLGVWLSAGEVVGHAAHIGGFAMGAFMGYVWGKCKGRGKKREQGK